MISIPFISIILDSIMSNYINMSTNFLTPLFTLTSLVILYPFINNDAKYLKLIIIVGLIYDIALTNTFFINTVLFVILYYFIRYINTYLTNNILNNILILIIAIILYRIMYYSIIFLSDYYEFEFRILFRSIYSSFVINMIYACILYVILIKLKKKYSENLKKF